MRRNVPESITTNSGRRMEQSGTHSVHSLTMSNIVLKVRGNVFLTPLDRPTSNVWYEAVPVGRNTLSKHAESRLYRAPSDGKVTSSRGREIAILLEKFLKLEISELNGHADPNLIPSYSRNPLEKQCRMPNKLAGLGRLQQLQTTRAALAAHWS